MSATHRARKRANALSVTGAAVAAAAVGAWRIDAIQPLLVPLLLTDLAAHAIGMTARHRLDRDIGRLPAIWEWLYTVGSIATTMLTVLGTWDWSQTVR